MSVMVMDRVWYLKLRPNEKFVLLAYADHAAHDGGSIWPSVAKICEKTSYSERSVQEITKSLQAKGLLVRDGKGPRGTNKWRVGEKVMAGAEIPPVQDEAGESPAMAPADLAPVQHEASEGAVMAPAEASPVQNETQGGAEPTLEGVRPTAPEPSLTVNEPSTGEELSQTGKDQAPAKETTVIDNAGKRTYVNRDKIPEQYLHYADIYHELSGQEPTKRVLHDWLTTFREWASEALRPEHVRLAYKEFEDRFTVTRPGSLTNTAVALKAKGRTATITSGDEEERKTKLLLAEIDARRARRTLPPPGLRERVHANLEKLSLKTET